MTVSAFGPGPGIYPLASAILNIINPLWGNLPLNFHRVNMGKSDYVDFLENGAIDFD